MADISDRDNDGTPDVLERIEQALIRIQGLLTTAAQSKSSESLQQEWQSATTKLDRAFASPAQITPNTPNMSGVGESAHVPTGLQGQTVVSLLQQINATLSLLQKSNTRAVSGLSHVAKTTAGTGALTTPNTSTAPAKLQGNDTQLTAPSKQPSGWAGVLDLLTGRDDNSRMLDRREKDARAKWEEARARNHAAPKEFRSAQDDHTRKMWQWLQAQEKGTATAKQENAAFDAQQRLEKARNRMLRAPQQLQQAEGELLDARRDKRQANAGNIPRLLGRVANMFGMEGMGKTLTDAADLGQMSARAATGDPTAMAGLAERGARRFTEGVSDVGHGTRRMLSSNRAGDVLAGAGQHVEGVGKMIGSPVLDSVGKFARTVGDSVERLRKWNDQLMDSNFRFAEFSGAMAKVAAEQEMRQIRLDQERGERRAGHADMHARSRDRLERNLAPAEDYMANFGGALRTYFNDRFSELIEAIQGAQTEPLNPMSFAEMANQVSQEYAEEMFGRPARFGGPVDPGPGAANRWLNNTVQRRP